MMTMTRRWIGLGLTLGASAVLLVATPARAAADGARFAVLVQGASGEEQYATLHRKWLDSLAALLRDRYKYDAAHLAILAEEPKTGEEKSTAEALKSVLARLTPQIGPADQLVIVLIGHGSAQGPDAKFNLVGPDLSVSDWAALLKPIRGHLAFVDTTGASFPYLAGLSAPGRVVITATNSAAQRYDTVFPEGFIQAFTTDSADLDKNGRISLLEAFVFASAAVKTHYEQSGTMATETAVLDDNGDGVGRLATATGPDGNIAGVTYLDGAPAATSADPEVQRLLTRRQQLNDQIDDLRRRRGTLAPDEYDKELDRLLTDLADVSREIRTRTGGG
jgi:hypothetical protein